MARPWFPTESAVGKRLWVMNETTPRTIVGVSADAKDRGIMRDSVPHAYMPLLQPGPKADAELTIAVRPRISDAKALAALRSAVHAIDRDQAVYDVRPAIAQLNRQIADQRFLLYLSTTYAGLTLLIALAGLFALLSNYVMDQRREIGVRLALGASDAAVVRHVCRPALAVSTVGAALGLALGVLGWWTMRTRVYGMQPPDPLVVTVVCAIVIAGCAAAACRPALRATRVDPAALLKTT
jgi:predicted lysophospholipase L1 biosynthesis ABC-type transport system permease subunit